MRRETRRLSVLLAMTTALVPATAMTSAGGTGAVTAAARPSARSTVFVADPLPTWQVDGAAWALASGRGVVYVGGEFDAVRPPGAAAGTREASRANFASFNARTGHLLKCAPRFTLPSGKTPTITALAMSPRNTTVYIGGRFSSVDGRRFSNFVALNTSTCLPRPGYPSFNGIVRTIVAQKNRVFVGGDFSASEGMARSRLAAMTASGQLLGWSPSADDSVRALTLDPAGSRLYAGGSFLHVDGQAIQKLVALDTASGGVVQDFPGWVDGTRERVTTLASDDRYVYLGVEGSGRGQFDGRIAADVDTGQLHWRVGCKGATQDVLPYRHVLYSASHSHDCSMSPGGFPNYAMDGRQHLLAESIANRTVLPWFPDTDEGPHGIGLGPHVLDVAAGSLWVGGEFTSVNKRPQQGLTRLPTRPDVGAPATHTPTAASPKAGRVTVTWPASWDRDDGRLIYTLYRDSRPRPVDRIRLGSRYWDRPTMTYHRAGLRSGSTHSYRVTVSDGINTSPLSKAATVRVR